MVGAIERLAAREPMTTLRIAYRGAQSPRKKSGFRAKQVAGLIMGWLPADEGNQYYLRAQLQFGF